jgi:hypothetical protein
MSSGLTKRRYPVITATRTRAAADGRSLISLDAIVITDAASRPAAAAKCRLPGQDQRRDPPGVRSRPGDWRVPQAGYLQEATPDTRGPGDGAAAGPGYAPPRCPRRGSRRIPRGPARPGRDAAAGGPSAATGRTGHRPGPPRRTPPAAASSPLREAPAVTAANAGCAGQTLTRARPLRRRAARTARPALVRMRSRNPCVFARRRLFGWNVRLLTEGSRYGGCFGRCMCPAARPGRFRTGRISAGLTGPMHVTRISPRRSNRWAARAQRGRRNNAIRAPRAGAGPRLWTSGPGTRAPGGS